MWCLPFRIDESQIRGGSVTAVATVLRHLDRRGVVLSRVFTRFSDDGFHVPTRFPSHERLALAISELRALEHDVDVVVYVNMPVPASARRPCVLLIDSYCYADELAAIWSSTWDALVVPSEHAARVLTSVTGEGRPAPVAISWGVERRPDRVAKRDGGPGLVRLAAPHRPDPLKGIDTAVLVVEALARRGHRAELDLTLPPTGDPDAYESDMRYVEQVRELVSRLRLESAVRWHPRTSQARTSSVLEAADWTLFLSRAPETLGLIALESLAVSTPVVVSEVGNLPELVPPGRGLYVVPPDDAEAAAEVVLSRLATSKAEARLGREHVHRRYDPQASAAEWEKLLSRVARARSRTTTFTQEVEDHGGAANA